METETLVKLIPPTITLIVTSLFGLLVGVIVEKFKNRFRILEYTIKTQKIIPPLSQSLGGQLSIKLNDREVNTLKVATIEIENKNSIDLENIVVRFSLGNDSWFQGNEAYIQKSFSNLYWTPWYTDTYNKVVQEHENCEINQDKNIRIVSQELQNRINFVLSNRDYLIPVFNRKDKAFFNFLIEDPLDGTEAGIFPTISHRSVNLIKKSDDEKQKLKDIWIGVIIGIVFVSIIITLMVFKYTDQKCLIIWSSIIGFSYSIVGFLILYGFRKTKSYFK